MGFIYILYFLIGWYLICLLTKKYKSSFGSDVKIIATMDGCPHCQGIKQMIKSGEIKIDGVTLLDATKNKGKLEELGIDSFPTIKNGNKEFTGDRTAKNINIFLGK